MTRRKSLPEPEPHQLVTEAREKIDLAAHVLRTDEDRADSIRNAEAQVDALEFRIKEIYERNGESR